MLELLVGCHAFDHIVLMLLLVDLAPHRQDSCLISTGVCTVTLLFKERWLASPNWPRFIYFWGPDSLLGDLARWMSINWLIVDSELHKIAARWTCICTPSSGNFNLRILWGMHLLLEGRDLEPIFCACLGVDYMNAMRCVSSFTEVTSIMCSLQWLTIINQLRHSGSWWSSMLYRVRGDAIGILNWWSRGLTTAVRDPQRVCMFSQWRLLHPVFGGCT